MDGAVRGSVKVVGSMIETGREQDTHWRSKAVRVVLEAVEGRVNTPQDCLIIRKMNYFTTS